VLGAATLQTLGQTYERPLARAVAALGNLTGSGLPPGVTSHDEGQAFDLRRIMGCFVEEKGMLASAHQTVIGIRAW
jgi:hypothetical protein